MSRAANLAQPVWVALGVPQEHHDRCNVRHGAACDCYMRRYAKPVAALVELEQMAADGERLRKALEQIAAWDCLNPPDRELLTDLPWLKNVVVTALAEP